jgi:hypothetical protein
MPHGGYGKGVMKRPGIGETSVVPAEETAATNIEEPRAPKDPEIRKLKETIKIMRPDIRKNKATIKDSMAKIKALEFELNIGQFALSCSIQKLAYAVNVEMD